MSDISFIHHIVLLARQGIIGEQPVARSSCVYPIETEIYIDTLDIELLCASTINSFSHAVITSGATFGIIATDGTVPAKHVA